MPSLKNITIVSIMFVVLLSGCTQVITAPIEITGAVISTTIDVTSSAVGAVAGSDDDEKEN